MADTRKTLERVPEGQWGFKPHEKSGTMGWLAGHVATLPSGAIETIRRESLDIAPVGAPPFRAREAIAGASDDRGAGGHARGRIARSGMAGRAGRPRT